MASWSLTKEERRARNDYREAARIERMFERMRTAAERHKRQQEYHAEQARERRWREKNADLSRRKFTPICCRVIPDRRARTTLTDRRNMFLAELRKLPLVAGGAPWHNGH
jgi:hypothetical protein